MNTFTTIQQVNQKIEDSTFALTRKTESIIEIAKSNEKIEQSKLTQLKHQFLPLIFKALEKEHLSLFELSYRKTGLDANWVEDRDHLVISFTAKPSDGKFKFIKFDGYTAQGHGRNQKRLDQKALDISQRMTEIIGRKVGVNQFSLEYKNEGENKSVMFSISI